MILRLSQTGVAFFHLIFILTASIAVSYLVLDLYNTIIRNSNNYQGKLAYAHVFNDTANAVTKNVDGRYQVAFLPYPARLLVNDTSTKLNFSIMENSTDATNLFTSLVIQDKNTGSIVEETSYEFHEFGDITYPYTFQYDGEYNVAIQAKINGDPDYESRPMIANFDVSVQEMQMSFQQLILFYVTPVLAGIVVTIIYARSKRGKKIRYKQ